jgi:hypothetical protein
MCDHCFRKSKEMIDAYGPYGIFLYISCVGCGGVMERINFTGFSFNPNTPASLVHVCLQDQDEDLGRECMEMITQINRIVSVTEEVSNRHLEAYPVGFFLYEQISVFYAFFLLRILSTPFNMIHLHFSAKRTIFGMFLHFFA